MQRLVFAPGESAEVGPYNVLDKNMVLHLIAGAANDGLAVFCQHADVIAEVVMRVQGIDLWRLAIHVSVAENSVFQTIMFCIIAYIPFTCDLTDGVGRSWIKRSIFCYQAIFDIHWFV